MPNWCQNKMFLSGPGEELDCLLATVRGVKSALDFDKIIPMPDALNIEHGTVSELALDIVNDDIRKRLNYHWAVERGITTAAELCAHLGQPYDEVVALGRQLLENKRLYGAYDWYDWKCENWGTKWNVAWEGNVVFERKNLTLAIMHFQTAWSPPLAIIRELGRMFPSIEIRLEFWEPLMAFAGKLVVAGGEELSYEIEKVEVSYDNGDDDLHQDEDFWDEDEMPEGSQTEALEDTLTLDVTFDLEDFD
jgi:hypothetical protein